MQLVIEVEESDPPAGTVMLTTSPGEQDTNASTPFVGWLGLIRALSEFLADPGSPGV